MPSPEDAQALRIAVAIHRHRTLRVASQALERCGLLVPGEVCRVREDACQRPRRTLAGFRQQNKAICLRPRERLEQHVIRHAVHGSRRGDPKGGQQRREQGERPLAKKDADAIAQILCETGPSSCGGGWGLDHGRSPPRPAVARRPGTPIVDESADSGLRSVSIQTIGARGFERGGRMLRQFFHDVIVGRRLLPHQRIADVESPVHDDAPLPGRLLGAPESADPIEGDEELLPDGSLSGQPLAACGGEPVVPPAPLSSALHPSPLDEAAVFEAVERWVEGGGVEGDRAARSLFDQAADVVAVTLALVEERQDQDFSAATLELALEERRAHMWRDYISALPLG